MYTGINNVQLLGRVGIDPRIFGKERQIVSFPLGTTVRYKVNNDDGSGTFFLHLHCVCIMVSVDFISRGDPDTHNIMP